MNFCIAVTLLCPTKIVTTFTGDPVAIPDGDSSGAAVDLPVTLNTGCGCTVANVAIDIGINHPYVDDLIMILVSPNGDGVVLVDQPANGGPNLVSTEVITFDDSVDGALNPRNIGFGLGTDDDIPAGTYNARGDLGLFNSITAAGDWKFFVTDNRSGNTGTIESVELTITCAV